MKIICYLQFQLWFLCGGVISRECERFHDFAQVKSLVNTTDRTYYHVEDDIANQDQLLMCSHGYISVYNQSSTSIKDVFGNKNLGYNDYPGVEATFDHISGIVQVNGTSILAVDSDNDCIRLLSRESLKTDGYIGRCKSQGYQNGLRNDSRLCRPYAIVQGRHHFEYFFTDKGNNAIRRYQFTDERVDDLITNKTCSDIVRPQDLVLDWNRQSVFVNVEGQDNLGTAVVKISLKNLQCSKLPLEFEPNGIVQVPLTNLYIVTHYGRSNSHQESMLTVINGTSLTIVNDSLCGGQTCNGMMRPHSITYSYHLNKLVIGARDGVWTLGLQYYPDGCKITRPTNITLPTSEPTSTVTIGDITTQGNATGFSNVTELQTTSNRAGQALTNTSNTVGGNDGQAEDADNRNISRTYMLSIGAGFIVAVFVILILALGIKLTRAQIKLKGLEGVNRIAGDQNLTNNHIQPPELPRIPSYQQLILTNSEGVSTLNSSTTTDKSHPYERIAPQLPAHSRPRNENGHMGLIELEHSQEVQSLHHYENTAAIDTIEI